MKSTRPEIPGFPSVLGEAIQRSNRSLVWLHARLAEQGSPVSLATLSYWRSGQRRPGAGSRRAIDALERLLDLDEGELSRHLDEAEGRMPTTRLIDSADVDRMAMEETIDALGRDLFGNLRERTTHVTIDVDASGQQRRMSLRTVAEAIRPEVERSWYVVWCAAPPMDDPRVRAVHGCRLDRSYVHPSRQVFGTVFTLDRKLVRGETSVIELEASYPVGFSESTRHQQMILHPVDELMIWVRFDPARLPRRRIEHTVAGVVEELVEEPVDGADSLLLVRRQFGPGTAELRWDF